MSMYRKTVSGKRATRKALKRYEQKNTDKRRRWVNTWKERVGIKVDDLQDLRRACKRLEAAVAAAYVGEAVHQPD